MGISDNGAFNSNLANIASANYGPTAVAGQLNTAANTAVQTQQAQAAGMQNQITKASMPLIMQALNEAGADVSGANPGNPEAGQGKQAPGTANAANADQSGSVDQFGTSGQLEDTIRNQNFIQPYTQSEMQQLTKWTSMAGLPGTAGDMAKARLAALQTQRQARIDNQTASNQRNMGNMYDSSAAVATADPNGESPGATFSAFKAADPQDAGVIQKEATDPITGKFDPVQADTLARDHSNRLAAVSHLYSGRPTSMNNGQLIDDKTAQPVQGQKQLYTGSTATQLGEDRKWAQEPIPTTMTDGSTENQPRWKAPKEQGGFGGSVTPDQYALQQDQARRKLATAGTPSADAGGPQVAPPTPAAAKPQPAVGTKLAAIRGAPPAAAPAPGSAPGAAAPVAGATTGQAQQPQSGVTDLATANPNPLPKGAPKVGPAPPAQDMENWKKYNDVAREKDATAGAALSAANSSIQGANNAQIALKAGAWTGPLSGKAQVLGTLLGNGPTVQTVLGNASSRSVLEKVLGVDAVMDIENAGKGTGGIRLGSQVLSAAINKLAASPQMTPDAIMTMTNAVKANANYDRQKYGPDYAAYKKAGGDVNVYEQAYSNKFPNRTQINSATLTGASTTAPKYSDAQIAAYAQAHGMSIPNVKTHLGMTQ
jgi:hypothetical protein